jgi:hypothetical protein
LWGGEQEHTEENRFVSEKGRTKHNEPIIIFQGTGIIISLNGSSGRMTFVKNKKFALNHYSGFFKIKKGTENLVDPEFFSLFYEKQLVEASVSEGSKTLTTQQIYEMNFDAPLYSIQKQIMSEMKPVLENKTRITKLLWKIASLKSRVLSFDYSKYQGIEVPINKILQSQSGNSGLTEEYLYSQIQDSFREPDIEERHKFYISKILIFNTQNTFRSKHY